MTNILGASAAMEAKIRPRMKHGLNTDRTIEQVFIIRI
jgi:hypothetical protein